MKNRIDEERSALQKWVKEQINWLNSQIESMETINLKLKHCDSLELFLKYSEDITLQNNKLQTLIEEFEILKKRILDKTTFDNVFNSETKLVLKTLIDKLLKINQEVFDTILNQLTKYEKELQELQSYRERFEKYMGTQTQPGNRVDYDI